MFFVFTIEPVIPPRLKANNAKSNTIPTEIKIFLSIFIVYHLDFIYYGSI